MAHTCPNCGNRCSTNAKLSEWERAEIRRRARGVMAEFPRSNYRQGRGGRQEHLRYLADEYGINIRTLYRYMREAA